MRTWKHWEDCEKCSFHPDVMKIRIMLQTKGAYDEALDALRAAGVELVSMDMHVLTELSERIMPDESLYTYEMPRELSRYNYIICPVLEPHVY